LRDTLQVPNPNAYVVPTAARLFVIVSRPFVHQDDGLVALQEQLGAILRTGRRVQLQGLDDHAFGMVDDHARNAGVDGAALVCVLGIDGDIGASAVGDRQRNLVLAERARAVGLRRVGNGNNRKNLWVECDLQDLLGHLAATTFHITEVSNTTVRHLCFDAASAEGRDMLYLAALQQHERVDVVIGARGPGDLRNDLGSLLHHHRLVALGQVDRSRHLLETDRARRRGWNHGGWSCDRDGRSRNGCRGSGCWVVIDIDTVYRQELDQAVSISVTEGTNLPTAIVAVELTDLKRRHCRKVVMDDLRLLDAICADDRMYRTCSLYRRSVISLCDQENSCSLGRKRSGSDDELIAVEPQRSRGYNRIAVERDCFIIERLPLTVKQECDWIYRSRVSADLDSEGSGLWQGCVLASKQCGHAPTISENVASVWHTRYVSHLCVRPATAADYPTIRGIILQGGSAIYRSALSPENFAAWASHTADDEHFIHIAQTGHLLVAERDDTILGTVSLSYAGTPWTRNHQADTILSGMYVREPGSGVGKPLLQAALAQARADRKQTVLLSALLSNTAAQRFYARVGFEHVSSHYYNGPVRWAAMRLQLSEVNRAQE
jgi:predicted GNAT family N-acyltransferase